MVIEDPMVTVEEAEAVHPYESVTVTVYVVVVVGVTEIPDVIPPCDHKYVPPPVAVILVELPLQIGQCAQRAESAAFVSHDQWLGADQAIEPG